MSDLWSDVRSDVLRRLEEHAPTVPFEEKVYIAENAAREAVEDAELFTPANVEAARKREAETGVRVFKLCGHSVAAVHEPGD